MRRLYIVLIVVFSFILVSPVQADGVFKKLYFIGLWQGVDADDGSEAQRSITLNRDGTFNIVGHEPYTNGCHGERGMITATGVLIDNVIISDDFTLTCFNGFGPYTMQATYQADRLNRTLIEAIPDSEFTPMSLHKISSR